MDFSQLIFDLTGEKGELVKTLCAWPSILYQSKKQGSTCGTRRRNFNEELLARSIVMFINVQRRWSQENLKQSQYYDHVSAFFISLLYV